MIIRMSRNKLNFRNKAFVTKSSLVLILLLSAFFRLYRFADFHYWGGDEEVLTATIRHIIWDRSPTLLVQNASLGFGLGPFYHYILAIFYWLADFDLVTLQIIGSLLGVVTTLLVYYGGRELGGKKTAVVAGVIYAASFFIAFFDRRVVHLTLNPILAALTFLTLAKVAKGHYRWLPLLAIPIGFAFHADASLLVLALAIGVSWLNFKIPVRQKHSVFLAFLVSFFFLPIILAEFRYQGAVVTPLVKSLIRPVTGEVRPPHNYRVYPASEFLNVLGRALMAAPSQTVEEYFAYDLEHRLPLATPLPQLIVGLLLIYGLVIYKRQKSAGLIVLWVMTGSFVIGLFIFNLLFKENFYQHYFMVFFPIFILLCAHVLVVVTKKSGLLLTALLTVYIFINLNTLVNSAVKYPLAEKLALVKQSLKVLEGKKFSLTASSDPYIHGGGWTELYTLQKQPAAKSYWYDFWGWIYAAYSLYPPGIDPSAQIERSVRIRKVSEMVDTPGTVINRYQYKDLLIEVLESK